MLSRFNKVVLSFLAMNTPALAFDTVVMDEQSSLFSAMDKTVPVITSTYIGWDAGWQWAGAAIKSEHSQQKPYNGATYSGKVDGLGINFAGEVKKASDKEINWTYRWDRQLNKPDALGFGIQFNIKLNSPTFSGEADDPVLLPNNEGWKWEAPNGQRVEVTFSPPIARIYFDQGDKSKIRTLFFTGVSKGSGQTTVSVKVSKSITMNAPSALSYGNSDESLWHKDILPVDTSPVDLSFLNKDDVPAGQHGFIVADKDKLFFEDNTPAKFWGTNVQAYALFSSTDAQIKRHAKRIAKLGFNLVRIHHHDSSWVEPNIFRNPETNTLELSDSALKKIDWWVKCLKDEGVYLWIDLHVGRRFMKADGIDGFSDLSHGADHAEGRGYNYYNDDIKELMKAFNHAYVTRENSFTGLAYKDDPAVIAYLITNENDLTHHFGNLFLEDKGVPVHNKIFAKDVETFARQNRLSKSKVEQTWKMGESKIYLNDVEHRFNQDMIDQLDDLGSQALIATTNSWGKMGLFSLPSLTDGSIIDTHSYGRVDEFKFNPRYKPGFLTWVGAAQVSAKPLSVTEWNIEPFPAEDRFTAPIYMASIANLQGWDAIMHYGYSQNGNWDEVGGSNYSTFNDPAMTGLMPAAALLYRQDHVAVANNTYELKLSREDFFFNQQDPESSKAIRTLLETSRFTIGIPDTPELPWMDTSASEEGAIVIHDANEDFIPAGQNFVKSDTGELKRDWNKGIHTINTEKSQIVSGWAGGESIELDDVKFGLKTKNVVVAVQSLENKSIRNSNKIFITAMARSKPEKGYALPFISEPVVGRIEISAIDGLRLYPINSHGKFDDKISVERRGGKYIIELTNDMKYHWFMLQDEAPAFDITFPADSAEYAEEEFIGLKTNVSKLEKEVSKVEYFYGDWSLISTVNEAPYDYGLRVAKKGDVTIRSRVTFKDGAKASSKIGLSIKEAPYQVTSPHEGEEISAGTPITIKTNALKWKDKVKSVTFWKDGWKHLSTDHSAPYGHTMSDLSAGEHLIRTRVTYLDGTEENSKVIKIKVVGSGVGTVEKTETGKSENPTVKLPTSLADALKEVNNSTAQAQLPTSLADALKDIASANDGKKDASNTPKTVDTEFSITSPVNGRTYKQGIPISFKTNASGWGDDVRLVEYWVDNWKFLYGSNTSPYEFSTNELSLGKHLIRSRLTFSDGSKSDSEITIRVVESKNISASLPTFDVKTDNKSGFDVAKAPAFRFISPENGLTVAAGEPITFKVQSRENTVNIDSVYYWYDDWKWLGRTITEPYEKVVNNLPAGKHAIHSRIIYRNGTTDLTSIDVNIENTGFQITSPVSGDVFKARTPITVKTNASLLQGNVMSVHFWRDNWKYIEAVYSEPYSIDIDDLSSGDHLLRARVIFDDASVLYTEFTLTVE